MHYTGKIPSGESIVIDVGADGTVTVSAPKVKVLIPYAFQGKDVKLFPEAPAGKFQFEVQASKLLGEGPTVTLSDKAGKLLKANERFLLSVDVDHAVGAVMASVTRGIAPSDTIQYML